jgi:hypothetical protein
MRMRITTATEYDVQRATVAHMQAFGASEAEARADVLRRFGIGDSATGAPATARSGFTERLPSGYRLRSATMVVYDANGVPNGYRTSLRRRAEEAQHGNR